MKNWIISAQGFLINCATFGFTSNYDSIMDGSFRKDLFYGTYGEKLMDLLGDMAQRRVFSTREIYKMEVYESTILNYLMDRLVPCGPEFRLRRQAGIDRFKNHVLYIG